MWGFVDHPFRARQSLLDRLPQQGSHDHDLLSLFREERAQLQVIADKYYRYALSAGPTNRGYFESLIQQVYRTANVTEPEDFLWFTSPPKAMFTAALLVWYQWICAQRFDLIHSCILLGSAPAFLDPGKFVGKLQQAVVVNDRHEDCEKLSLLIQSEILNESDAAVSGFTNVITQPVLDLLEKQKDREYSIDVWLDWWLELEQLLEGKAAAVLWQKVGRELMSVHDDVQRGQIDTLDAAIEELVTNYGRGRTDAMTCALYDCLLHLGMPISNEFESLVDCIIAGVWFWPFNDVCIVFDQPTEISLNRNLRLDNFDDYAIRFPDGWGAYAISGIAVSEEIAYGRFTVNDIEIEDNQEVRRAMIDRYGLSQFLFDSGCKIIHKDNFGTLYRKAESDRGEDIVMVEVVNCTQERDGSFKRYFLRVPPDMKTAHQAVAWTFGLSESEYEPRKET